MISESIVRCPRCGAAARDAAQKCPDCGRALQVFGIGGVLGGLFAYLLGLAGVAALLTASWSWASYGYTLVALIPVLLGLLCGYLVLWKRLGQLLAALAGLTAVLIGGMMAGVSGALCSLILAAIYLAPLLLGIALGRRLRRRREAAEKTRRGPTVVSCIGLFCLLATGLYVESFVDPSRRVAEVRTSRTLQVSVEEAWKGLTFYEDVPEEQPALLRLALPQPIRTVGRSEKVGDITVCLYEKGRLVKRVSELSRPRRLAFEVVGQRGVEDRSVILVDGSFEFEALGPARTRATLTTRYRPLLSARIVWRPFEVLVARALHERVLKTIEERGGRSVGP